MVFCPFILKLEAHIKHMVRQTDEEARPIM